ncbi:MAG TPA: branched-chain amino acid aminotransferase [Spirochaetota bacterium]|nr:branched-chain amino acid aminotransferase [Spirochaetota bacterium]
MSSEKANMDWSNLSFGYQKTDFNIRYYYKKGKWSKGELVQDENLNIHMAAPCLHYGQECFEGIKAFETKTGKIVVFRPEENWKRLQKTSERISIPPMPKAMFVDACKKVISANRRFVPPYGTGASLYLRPLVIGTGPRVGLGPADEYIFVIFVTPVGPYYKGGIHPVKAIIALNYDRAAPDGVGDCKVGGNYAAGLAGDRWGHDKGYSVVLYLDSREKRYIDEFSTSNFIGIKGNSYVTPKSKSILPSITNMSLAQIAEDIGLKVERRPVDVAELADFDEIGAVGTAAVVTPVTTINYKGKNLKFGSDKEAGPVITKLYNTLTGIQYGDIKDTHKWLVEVK